MKTLLKVLSAIGLILTIGPSIMVFTGNITFEMHKWLMFLGTVLWFVTAPFWMNKKTAEQ